MLSILCNTFMYPTNHILQRYFCRTLYLSPDREALSGEIWSCVTEIHTLSHSCINESTRRYFNDMTSESSWIMKYKDAFHDIRGGVRAQNIISEILVNVFENEIYNLEVY